MRYLSLYLQAGNLEYDGEYKYTYDAWDRLVEVKRAYGNTPTVTSKVGTIRYDGLGRQVSKAISESGDWSNGSTGMTCHYYYDGQANNMIETRNGSDQTLKQHVWGLTYVDELLQVGINQDPDNAALTGNNFENDCERFFWALQDANYNVLGLVSATGDLVERYEYTPYGRRTVFSRGWLLADMNDDGLVNDDDEDIWDAVKFTYTSASRADLNGDGQIDASDHTIWNSNNNTSIIDDPLVMQPRLESFRNTERSMGAETTNICNIGHQGLMHDKEFGLIYNRARYLSPKLGRFLQRDPLGYVDGMSLYEYVNSRPTRYVDPQGTWKRSINRWDHSTTPFAKRNQCCAQAGDSLQTLAAKAEYGGNAENWRCLWPLKGTKDHGYTKGRVQPGDMYDANNLTQRGWGPTVRINMDTDDKAYARVRGAAFKATTGTAVYALIKKYSKEGGSPIHRFEINGHSGDWARLSSGEAAKDGAVRDHFRPKRYPPNYPIPTFARAQKRQGPHRCWFRRNAKVRAIACGGLKFGESFAASFLRRGAFIKTTRTGVETGSSTPWFCETRWYFTQTDRFHAARSFSRRRMTGRSWLCLITSSTASCQTN